MKNNTDYLAWPRSNLLNAYERISGLFNSEHFHPFYMRKVTPVNSLEQGFNLGSQYVVDIKRSKYHLNMQRNESLIEERKINSN